MHSNKTKRATLLLFVMASTIVMNSCATFRAGQNASSFFFFQMTDPQFGFFSKNNDVEQETINFERAIAEANRLRPAFVVVCGDLVNKVGDSAQIAAYKRITSKLDKSIPLYNLIGNHDAGNTPTPATLDDYRRNFGPDYYSFEHGDFLGIVLNSSLFFDSSRAPEEAEMQDKWLRETLSEAKKNKHIVVFQHIPWFLDSLDEKDQYFNIPSTTRKKYIDLFIANKVKFVFAGHLHRNAIGHEGDLEMITTGPVGRPLGKDPSGFRIVRVNGNQISHRYYALDEVPSKIEN